MSEARNQDILRHIPGRKYRYDGHIVGPGGISNGLALLSAYGKSPISMQTIGPEFDDIIVDSFERIRNGLSVDAFLADPKLARRLAGLCIDKGVESSQFAIAMRLFAIRKRGQGDLERTQTVTHADRLLASYASGVESAMLFVYTRFGASVDTAIAHPTLQKLFSQHARRISPGATIREYSLCALSIRKTRFIGQYLKKMENFHADDVESRWLDAGRPAARKGVVAEGTKAGLAELRSNDRTLFLLRNRDIVRASEQALEPGVVQRLIQNDWFHAAPPSEMGIRILFANQLPQGITPKVAELAILRDRKPPFNWPLLAA